MTEQQAREFAEALGAEITRWRKTRKLTRSELGKLAGISDTTVGRIERGGEDAAAATTAVWRIAKALDLTFTYLVRRAEDAMDASGPSDTPDLRAVASTETLLEPGIGDQTNGDDDHIA